MKEQWSVDDILALEPCHDYSRDRIEELFREVGCSDYVTPLEISRADIPIEDFLWLVLRPEIIPERQLHEIAIWCWEEIARPIYEKHYPEDRRPHDAVAVKRLWIEGEATDDELAAARAAAWNAAWNAARAAARAAAWNVARAAARAAARNVARAAAWDAAWDSARDSAWDAAWDKIKKHVISVMGVA